MESLQFLIKKDLDVSVKIPALFKAARKYYGITQAEVAKKLQIEQGTLSKIETGHLTPTVDLWYFFCKFMSIPFESATYGFIDSGRQISLIPCQHETGFRIPKKFSETRADSVRNLLPLLRFFATRLGIRRLKEFLNSQKMDPLFFLIYDNLLNINFRIELVRALMKEGILKGKNIPEIFTNTPDPMPMVYPYYENQKIHSQEIAISSFIKAQKYYQLDFHYDLNHAGSKIAELSITPEPHLKDFDYRSTHSLGKFQCLYQKAQLKYYLESSVKELINIKELECHYVGRRNKSCTYELRAAR